jgi:glycosyltransferase involved in cell wall biosynthesis
MTVEPDINPSSKFIEEPAVNPRGKFIVACIPAYNQDTTIASVIIKTQKYVNKVIVYDDGSRDQTRELAALLDTELISENENKGKGYAMRRMFQQALDIGADAVVTLDSDGQHNPNEIPKILAPILNDEADMVLGSRYAEGGSMDAPLYRRFGLKVINSISNGGSKYNIHDTQNGFRAYSRKALEAMLACRSDGYGIETEELSIATQYGLRINEVPVAVRYKDLENTSKKNPLGHGVEIIEMALKLVVEKRPLLLLGLPGTVLLFSGLMAGIALLFEFNSSRYFSIPFALVALGGLVTGVFLIMTALILYGIRSIYNNKK